MSQPYDFILVYVTDKNQFDKVFNVGESCDYEYHSNIFNMAILPSRSFHFDLKNKEMSYDDDDYVVSNFNCQIISYEDFCRGEKKEICMNLKGYTDFSLEAQELLSTVGFKWFPNDIHYKSKLSECLSFGHVVANQFGRCDRRHYEKSELKYYTLEELKYIILGEEKVEKRFLKIPYKNKKQADHIISILRFKGYNKKNKRLATDNSYVGVDINNGGYFFHNNPTESLICPLIEFEDFCLSCLPDVKEYVVIDDHKFTKNKKNLVTVRDNKEICIPFNFVKQLIKLEDETGHEISINIGCKTFCSYAIRSLNDFIEEVR